jgi:hypothetical protein
MSDYYALTRDPLPTALYGADGQYSIRPLADWERIAIEDRLFTKGIKLDLKPSSTAVVVPTGGWGTSSVPR